MQFDLMGLSAVIGSAAAAVVSIGTFVMGWRNNQRQQLEHDANLRREQQGVARDAKLDTIATSVNGLNDKIASSSHDAGRAEGILIGGNMERDRPDDGA